MRACRDLVILELKNETTSLPVVLSVLACELMVSGGRLLRSYVMLNYDICSWDPEVLMADFLISAASASWFTMVLFNGGP